MNFSKRKNRSFSIFGIALSVAALAIVAMPSLTNSIARASGAGLEVEVPFEINALKAPGLVAPYFLQDNHGAMVVSDQAGGVYSVTFGGKVTPLADKTKIKNPAGVAIGPAGFGSYEGNVFVLAAAGGIKGPCEVERIDKSGAVSTFAKLPDAGATECRDMEFGAAGSPFAGKLYAAASGNASIYAIDSSGKASVFGAYNKPVQFELTTITFAPSSDVESGGHDAGRDAREGKFRGEGRPYQHGRRRRQDEGRDLPGGIHTAVGLRVVAVDLRLVRRRVDDRRHRQIRLRERQRARRHGLSGEIAGSRSGSPRA